MKSVRYLFLFLSSAILLSSCLRDSCTDQLEYTRFDPVYMTANEFRITSIETESLKALENPGKMYFYNNHIFINEKGEGIHVYDNSDKENPTFVIFYKIPGNFDIAIKDGYLVADNVIDMITINIEDLYNPTIINREEDYKQQYTNWEPNEDYNYWAYSVASPVKQIVDCSDSNFGQNTFRRGDVFFAEWASVDVLTTSDVSNSTSSSTGIGGSTSRFTIIGDYLYIASSSSLLTYEFKSKQAPVYKDSKNLGWGIETIYPFNDNLFIGSNAGMYIFGLSNPESPNKLSTFEHARACDPVVVNETTAYVTLRDGRFCEGFSNQLDVIDISDLTDPTLIKSYPMQNPNGMSLNGNTLYLSEGSFGLKVLDVTNSNKVKETFWNKDISSTDLIYLGNNHLMSIGSDGFHQFDVSDVKNIREISFIPVQ